MTLQKDRSINDTSQRRINVRKVLSLDDMVNKPYSKVTIELNENFLSQYKEVLDIMKKNNFKLTYSGKINPISFPIEAIEEKRTQKFNKTYNFHFIKNN